MQTFDRDYGRESLKFGPSHSFVKAENVNASNDSERNTHKNALVGHEIGAQVEMDCCSIKKTIEKPQGVYLRKIWLEGYE